MVDDNISKLKGDKLLVQSKTVLLVDDEGPVLEVCESMLRRLGCEVVSAEDGYQAITHFSANTTRFDCIILDLTMPGMSGDVCFKVLREINPKIPIIISSGYSEQDLLGRFALRSASSFIQKPFELADLLSTLADVINAAEEDRPPKALSQNE